MPHASHMFDLEQLPDEAQSIICSLASTPSCPTHALLALVSKRWDAIAAQHFQLDGAGVTLQLASDSSSTTEQKRREVERLVGLAMWLRRRGPAVGLLDIHIYTPGTPADKQQFVLGRSHGICGVLESLAAASKQPRGLRLQQLRLPAFGSAPPSTICQALAGCRHLRALQLDYSCGAGGINPAGYLVGDVCTTLQQLTHLTFLQLNVGKFKYMADAFSLDELFGQLPSSLAEVGMEVFHDSDMRRTFTLATNSLQHLTALQHLDLFYDLCIKFEFGDDSLAPLTALTSLRYSPALQQSGRALLAAPNLVKVTAQSADPLCLNLLTPKTSLRALAFTLAISNAPAAAAALARLTQLTGLSVGLPSGVAAVVGPAKAEVAAAVSSLVCLQSLSLHQELLERVPIAPLTALTCLLIDAQRRGTEQAYGRKRIKKLVSRLAPARGRLRVVVVSRAEAAKQEMWRAAAAAVLGGVEVMFR